MFAFQLQRELIKVGKFNDVIDSFKGACSLKGANYSMKPMNYFIKGL